VSILSRGRFTSHGCCGVDASSCGGWIFVSFPSRRVVVFWLCVVVSWWWCRRRCVAAFMHRRVVSLSHGGGGVVASRRSCIVVLCPCRMVGVVSSSSCGGCVAESFPCSVLAALLLFVWWCCRRCVVALWGLVDVAMALGARWSSLGLLGSVGVGDVVVGRGWMAWGLPPVWVGVQWAKRRERRGGAHLVYA
jgi:hypothetical protein